MDVRGRVLRLGSALPGTGRPERLNQALGVARLPRALSRALADATRGESTTLELVLTTVLGPVDAALRIECATEASARVVVTRFAPRDAWARTPLTYVISVRSGFGRLTSVDGRPAHGSVCHELLADSDEPCDGCPARALEQQPSARRAGGTPNWNGEAYRVAVAERLDGATMRVRSVPVTDGMLGELMRQKLEQLSERAQLSKRERAVLALLVLGRSLAQMASGLGITERTVRFHVGNVLRKLGAESRADLLRLLV